MTESASHVMMVVRCWGLDRPGIAEAFLEVVDRHNCPILDMSQFLVEDSLMFTFEISAEDKSSLLLVKELNQCGKKWNLEVAIDFPDSAEEETNPSGNKLMLSMVSNKQDAIGPALLHDVDVVLSAHGCVVDAITHRSDNKVERNGEYTKLSLNVICPQGVQIGSLYLGGPNQVGLQQVVWDHGAEISIRRWDNLKRPNKKSLVVFGLSNVLCPYDMMDEVLKEAGVDPQQVPSDWTDLNRTQRCHAKAAMLKDKPVDVVQKFIDRMEFTPGAQFVCSTLKKMGFTLAILTNTGVKAIGEHVKKHLNIDYVICQDLAVEGSHFTGDFTGEASDVRFRKADVLGLMAEREGIAYRDVITVGELWSDLKFTGARQVLNTFGPSVWFNRNKLNDLTIVLYLLGLDGNELRQLKKRKWEDGPGAGGAQHDSAKRYMVQVSTKTQSPGQMRHIFAPLQHPPKGVAISTVRQCSLRDGGMVVGIDMNILNSQEDQVIKDLLFSCQKQGYNVLQVADRGSTNFKPWFMDVKDRAVITVVQKPQLTSSSVRSLFGSLAEANINIVHMERLSVQGFTAMAFYVTVPQDVPPATIKEMLVRVSNSQGCDVSFQADDIDRWMSRLVVFDMDSTLIQQEVIDELAKYAGVGKEVSAITEAAMNGEYDFFGSLKARVALLAGHDAEELFSKVKQQLIFTPGAKRLCKTLKRLGYKMAVISGGFLPVAQEVQKHLGLDYAFANTLEVDEQTGLLTGKTSGPVVTPQRKRALLATIANVEGCSVSQTIAVGDGANDIPMLHTAGLGIAFCAKPKVQAVAEFRINQKDLSTVMFLMGISEHAAEKLSVDISAEDLAREGDPVRP